MNEQNLKRIIDEKLEHGRKLRESTTLIKCRAIVEFDDGSNWQPTHAYIPPEKINSEGYVEEVWIDLDRLDIKQREDNGEVHYLITPGWLANLNMSRVDRFEVFEQEPSLIPDPKLIVRYRINKQQLS